MSGSIVALDPGTRTGWAVWRAGHPVRHGTADFAPGRFEGGGMRWLRFRRWLAVVLEAAAPVEELVFEEVRRHAGTTAAHIYGGFVAEITAMCEERDIPYRAVPVQHIKRHATGKGNARKEQVIEAVKAKGFEVADDNEADAVALLLLALSEKEGA